MAQCQHQHQAPIAPNHFTIHVVSPTEMDTARAQGTWGMGPQPQTALPWAKLSKISIDTIMDKLGSMPSITKAVQKQIDARHAQETWACDNQIFEHTQNYIAELATRLGKTLDADNDNDDALGTIPMDVVTHGDHDDEIEALFDASHDGSDDEEDENEVAAHHKDAPKLVQQQHYLLHEQTPKRHNTLSLGQTVFNDADQNDSNANDVNGDSDDGDSDDDTHKDDLLRTFLDAHPDLAAEIGIHDQTARILLSRFMSWTAKRIAATSIHDLDSDEDDDELDVSVSNHK